jgi:ubiquinone/menaquinone biosynthesis C-methylase UbiE
MEAKTIDAGEFREAQRNSWNKAATGWDKWATQLLEWTGHVSERLVELAGVEAGSRVLDVAAGLGEPALTAARRAGPEGTVVATDIAPEMLAHARKRVAAAGVSNVEFIESEASKLDFPEASFDAAVSRWGIIFEPEAEATAARIRRFLKPGSRMAISSWGPPPEVPMIALPMMAVLGYLQQPPPPPGTPGPLSRPTPEAISAILEGGGFSGVEVEETQVVISFASPEEFTTHVQDIVAPLVALLEPHPQEVRDAAWNAVTEAARQHAGDDGTVTMTNKVLLASGTA